MGNGAIVTGASGFIGTRLVRALAGRGVRVLALDLLPPRERVEGVEYRVADVRAAFDPAIAAGVGAIYNLAAVHRTPGHPPHEYYDANVDGALTVTALAEAAGVETVVFTSSISVYGPGEDLKTEGSALAPTSDYGRSKRMAEAIHRRWAAGDPARRLVVVRPGVVFGPGERGNYTHLAAALRRGAFAYPGRRDTVKSGGYVDELLRTFDFALGRGEREITYNFAYPDASTTQDIVHAFARVAGTRERWPTLPYSAMRAAAGVFEAAAVLGLRTPIHRERIDKLVRSTRIAPAWLQAHGYAFETDLEAALTRWRDETGGTFA